MTVRTTRSIVCLTALLAMSLLLTSSPLMAKQKAGEVQSYQLASPSPYDGGAAESPMVLSEEIYVPDATFIKIHFSEFDLAPGDRVVIRGDEGQQHVYTGRGPRDNGEFWAFSVRGSRAMIDLYSYGQGGHGFVIDQIGRGIGIISDTAVCGSDGRRDVACYGEGAKNITEPVAHLLFCDGFFCFFCTGFLVNGDRDNLMMTNEHCINNQQLTDTLEASFNFQNAQCNGGANDPTSVYNGDDFVTTDAGLDYTLLTLMGSPEANHGEFDATDDNISVGDLMAMPQHSGGGEKTVAVYEDSGQSIRCDVEGINANLSGWDPGTQLYYSCDMEGGASGSPVLGISQRAAIGINHVEYIGCPGGSLVNYGTQMSDICADAGSLLNCI